MIKEKQMNKNKKLANMAMLVALAMIFSYVESLIPINFGIPGMKLGVANLVTVTGMYFLEFPEVFLVVVMRILLTGFLFGNGMSIVYSLAGGILSFLVMALMKRLKGFSVAGVSIAGGVSHNIGQIIVASVVIENLKLIYYLPALLIAGTVTGFVMGIHRADRGGRTERGLLRLLRAAQRVLHRHHWRGVEGRSSGRGGIRGHEVVAPEEAPPHLFHPVRRRHRRGLPVLRGAGENPIPSHETPARAGRERGGPPGFFS